MKKRALPPFYQKRQYPRIFVEADVPCPSWNNRQIRLSNFNYVYAAFSGDEPPDRLTFAADSIELACKKEQKINDFWLYEIEGQDELYSSQEMCDRIMYAILSLAAGDAEPEPIEEERKKEFYEVDLV